MKRQGLGIWGWRLGTLLGLGLLVVSSAAFARDPRAAAGEEYPTIIVIIHNYGRVPGGTLDEAKAATTRILALAGVKTAWQESPGPVTGSASSTAFRRRANGVEINLHLIPRAMAVRLPSDKLCLGLSILPGGDKRGDIAYVFCHRVEDLAGNGDASAGQILGHAMAHEIGHLLLNSSAHSPVGIMQGEWDKRELTHLQAGRLLFTSEQSHLMRAEVLARQTGIGISQATTTQN
ncbi:MAG: hypothetical protein ABSA41_10830 [Terriglobia bacterium]